MDNIFYRTLLNDKVKIEPKMLSREFRKNLLNKLKSSVEGVCSKHGYVKTGSIELYKVSPGSVDLTGLNGYIIFDVYYWAEVCNPMIGNVIKATVMNVNKFGILADAMNILEIIIAKNSVSITHETTMDIDQIKIGDSVTVEIIGKKFELNDKKISIIGKIVSEDKKVHSKKDEDNKEDEYDDDKDDVLQEYVDGLEGGGVDSESDINESEEDVSDEEENSIDGDEEALYYGGDKGFFESDEESDGHVSDQEDVDYFSEGEEDGLEGLSDEGDF